MICCQLSRKDFEALVVAGADSLAEMDSPRVLVRATHHNKAMFWERLDAEVQELFRFELKSLRGLFQDRVNGISTPVSGIKPPMRSVPTTGEGSNLSYTW